MSIELFHVIGDMSIYRTCVIKFVIYQYNSNILDFEKEKKKKNTPNSHFSLIKKKNYCPLFGGLRPWPKWPRPRPRAGPDHQTVSTTTKFHNFFIS